MTRKELTELRELLQEMDVACREFLREMDSQQRWDNEKNRYVTEPTDYLIAGTAKSGAVRRKSMDLTRALAALRKAR